MMNKQRGMKGIISILMVFSLLVSVPAIAAEQDGVHFIDFEDYNVGSLKDQKGWSGVANATIDGSIAYGGTKSLKIIDEDDKTASGATFPVKSIEFDPIVKGTIEFWARAEQEDLLTFILEDGSGVRAARIGFFSDASFEYFDPERSLTEKKYNVGEWYKLSITFDLQNKTKRTVITDSKSVLFDEDTTLIDESVAGISRLRMATFNASVGTFYVDNIMIRNNEIAGDYDPLAFLNAESSQPTPGQAGSGGSTGSTNFTDLQDHWAKADIEQLAEKKIVLGLSDGVFAPNRAITRADFTAYLVRGLGLEEERSASEFGDVSSNHQFAGAIGAAVKAGLIQGMGDNLFAPDLTITREQMAVIFARAMKLQGKEPSVQDVDKALAAFVDHGKISDWATAEVSKVVEVKIIQGNTDNEFSPQKNATRAEAAVMLKRFLTHLGVL